MNAVEFVRNKGWDEAQETVKENSNQLRILSTWEVELKRLVDSWELVEEHGGLAVIKECVLKTVFPLADRIIRMKQAIEDVES